MKKKIIAFVSLAAVVAGGIFIVTNNSASQVSANAFNTSLVRLDTITETVTARAEVSLTNSELIFSATRAEVYEVYVENGDIVEAGAPLLRFRERSREDIETRLTAARLSLQSSQIMLNNELIPPTSAQITSAQLEISRAERSIADLESERAAVLENIARHNTTSAEDTLLSLERQLEAVERNIAVTTETLALSKMSLEDLENRLNSPQSQNIIAQREISVSQAQLEVDRIQKELDDFQELIDQNRTGLTERQRDDRKEEIERRLEAVTLNLRSAQIALENELIPVSDTQITNARLDISRTERSLADLESERENILLNISRQTTTNHEDRLNTYNRQLEAIDRNIRMTEETKLLAEINLVDIQNRLNSPQSQNNVSQRRINVSQAQLEVDRIERELSDFSEVLYSPISGTITDLRISQGEISPTERPLMEVSNIGEFVVRAFVNERNIARVELGQEVKIEANVLGRGNYATGIVTRIDQIAQTRQSTTGQEIVVPVEITVNPSVEASQLKPGFSLDVTITTSINTDVVVVSILSTLTDADGNAFVFVVRDDNSLERRMVTTGAFADMYMEVIGLNAGETIVSQPTLNMYDGMIITAIR